jgi:hypothetical protein
MQKLIPDPYFLGFGMVNKLLRFGKYSYNKIFGGKV